MALHDRPVRLTDDDFALFPEDGLRHEILDGEHYVTPAPYVRHQIISMRFSAILAPFVFSRQLGLFVAAPIDVILSRYDVVEPDLVFVSKERLGIVTRSNIQGAPDLIIEILSQSTKRVDQGTKLARYERFGVQEYWLADPDLNTVTVYRLEGERYRDPVVLSADADGVLRTPLFPGLEIRLAEIFAD